MSENITDRIKQLENQNIRLKKLLESALQLGDDGATQGLTLEADNFRKVIVELESEKEQLQSDFKNFLSDGTVDDFKRIQELERENLEINVKLQELIKHTEKEYCKIELKSESEQLQKTLERLEKEKDRLFHEMKQIKESKRQRNIETTDLIKMSKERLGPMNPFEGTTILRYKTEVGKVLNNNSIEDEVVQQTVTLTNSSDHVLFRSNPMCPHNSAFSAKGGQLLDKIENLEELKVKLQSKLEESKSSGILDMPVENTVLELKISSLEREKNKLLKELEEFVISPENDQVLTRADKEAQVKCLIKELEIQKILLTINLRNLVDIYATMESGKVNEKQFKNLAKEEFDAGVVDTISSTTQNIVLKKESLIRPKSSVTMKESGEQLANKNEEHDSVVDLTKKSKTVILVDSSGVGHAVVNASIKEEHPEESPPKRLEHNFVPMQFSDEKSVSMKYSEDSSAALKYSEENCSPVTAAEQNRATVKCSEENSCPIRFSDKISIKQSEKVPDPLKRSEENIMEHSEDSSIPLKVSEQRPTPKNSFEGPPLSEFAKDSNLIKNYQVISNNLVVSPNETSYFLKKGSTGETDNNDNSKYLLTAGDMDDWEDMDEDEDKSKEDSEENIKDKNSEGSAGAFLTKINPKEGKELTNTIQEPLPESIVNFLNKTMEPEPNVVSENTEVTSNLDIKVKTASSKNINLKGESDCPGNPFIDDIEENDEKNLTIEVAEQLEQEHVEKVNLNEHEQPLSLKISPSTNAECEQIEKNKVLIEESKEATKGSNHFLDKGKNDSDSPEDTNDADPENDPNVNIIKITKDQVTCLKSVSFAENAPHVTTTNYILLESSSSLSKDQGETKPEYFVKRITDAELCSRLVKDILTVESPSHDDDEEVCPNFKQKVTFLGRNMATNVIEPSFKNNEIGEDKKAPEPPLTIDVYTTAEDEDDCEYFDSRVYSELPSVYEEDESTEEPNNVAMTGALHPTTPTEESYLRNQIFRLEQVRTDLLRRLESISTSTSVSGNNLFVHLGAEANLGLMSELHNALLRERMTQDGGVVRRDMDDATNQMYPDEGARLEQKIRELEVENERIRKELNNIFNEIKSDRLNMEELENDGNMIRDKLVQLENERAEMMRRKC